MIHHIFNFILGTAATVGTASVITDPNPNNFGTLEELIKYLISIVGGILTAIIINLLKKKFPEWFQNQKKA